MESITSWLLGILVLRFPTMLILTLLVALTARQPGGLELVEHCWVNFRRVLARPDAMVEPLGSCCAIQLYPVGWFFGVGARRMFAAQGGSRHPLPPSLMATLQDDCEPPCHMPKKRQRQRQT